MGLQYKRVRGDCPITITVPNDGSVRGYLITKCVVANHDGSGPQTVVVAHDTVKLAEFQLAHALHQADYAETGSGNRPASTGADTYFAEFIGNANVVSYEPVAKDVRQAAGVWLAPGDTFQVTGTNCRGSVTYFEEI